jgi:DNA modification methylase
MTITILTGCCLSILATLPDKSIHTCITSPPYFGLRDYGTARWEGGDSECSHLPSDTPFQRGIESSTLGGGKNNTGHKQEGFKRECPRCGAKRKDDQLGLEPTPEEYVANMVKVFREVRRVLRDDGTLWLNLGDSYAGAGPSGASYQSETTKRREHINSEGAFRISKTLKSRGLSYAEKKPIPPPGLKKKDLVGIPWMLAFALRKDGWYLRSDIIWSKLNSLPESVTDRPTKSHEYIFLLSKSANYHYDHQAIREPAAESSIERWNRDVESQEGSHRANGAAKANGNMKAVGGPRRSEKQRGHSQRHAGLNDRWDQMPKDEEQALGRNKRSVWTVATKPFSEAHFATYPPDLIEPCILAGCPKGGTVLDPFFGAGTTALVADRHGRDCVGIELNEEYVRIAEKRLRRDAGMFADIVINPSHL